MKCDGCDKEADLYLVHNLPWYEPFMLCDDCCFEGWFMGGWNEENLVR